MKRDILFGSVLSISVLCLCQSCNNGSNKSDYTSDSVASIVEEPYSSKSDIEISVDLVHEYDNVSLSDSIEKGNITEIRPISRNYKALSTLENVKYVLPNSFQNEPF